MEDNNNYEHYDTVPPLNVLEPKQPGSPNPRFAKQPYTTRQSFKEYTNNILNNPQIRNYEFIHTAKMVKARAALYKRFYQEDRMKQFEMRREAKLREKVPPKKFIDNHMLEKVVSRRRIDLQQSQKSENPASLPPFSPRIPLPQDPGRFIPPNRHVFYWGC